MYHVYKLRMKIGTGLTNMLKYIYQLYFLVYTEWRKTHFVLHAQPVAVLALCVTAQYAI
jgi:hypothetical protein